MNEKRFGVMEGVIAGLALLVIVLVVAILMAHAYPQAADTLVTRATSGRPWVVDRIYSAEGFAQTVADRARMGWEHRFAGPVMRFAGGATSHEGSAVVLEPFPEGECLDCHPNFRDRPLFSVVFSPHELHGSNEIPCSRCHEASGPNRCQPSAMSGCADCHEQTGTVAECDTCHPPGSLFHGAALTGSRELGMQCEICHRPSVLVAGARNRGLATFSTSPESCDGCHDKSYCDRCHPASHPGGYGSTHFSDFQLRQANALECYQCHLTGWCAMRCHAVR